MLLQCHIHKIHGMNIHISYSLFPLCHSAGMAPVHPGERQPVYRHGPTLFYKNKMRSHSANVAPV